VSVHDQGRLIFEDRVLDGNAPDGSAWIGSFGGVARIAKLQ